MPKIISEETKKEAIRLRIEEKQSLSYISKKLNIAKSSSSILLRKYPLTTKRRNELNRLNTKNFDYEKRLLDNFDSESKYFITAKKIFKDDIPKTVKTKLPLGMHKNVRMDIDYPPFGNQCSQCLFCNNDQCRIYCQQYCNTSNQINTN